MGDIVELRCDNCGFSGQYMLGVGRTHHIAEKIVEAFDEELGDRVRELLEKGSADWSFEKCLGKCQECRKIVSVPALLFKGGTDGSIHGKCECGGELRLWSLEQLGRGETPACPSCGVKLTTEHAGYWD